MKTHHYIFLSTFLFVVLFYNESIGLNLGILGLIYSISIFAKTPSNHRTNLFYFLFGTSVLSSFAWAWFGDFSSFLALVISLLMLSFRSKQTKLKTFMVFPVFITNFFTAICRVFSFEEWIPKGSTSGLWQKILAFVLIPLIFVVVFFAIYSAGSDSFAAVFNHINFDFNVWEILCLSVLGFFIAFNYYNFIVERVIYKNNHVLSNEFSSPQKEVKSTFSFLDFDAERTSGVVSLLLLNVMLIFFIGTYTFEQFYQTEKSPNYMSEETHNRVEAVIGSIVMAIVVILFYFKSSFNFDAKNIWLKRLAKLWIVLNLVLIVVTAVKNTEYLILHAFTYKKLGVYAFLLLSAIGLVVTFIKIQRKKTNAFLFNSMLWAFYGMVLVCSYVNWGGIMTAQNIKRKDFAIDFHRYSVSFSDRQLLKYAEERKDEALIKKINLGIENEKKKSFLSKILFYETIKTQ